MFSREVYWHICLRGLSHCGWCLAGKSAGISVCVDCRTVVAVYGEVYWHICLRGLSHCGWCLAGKCTGISVCVDCRTVVGV